MKRIKRFGIYQTAKVSAAIYFFISLLFVLPILIFSMLFGGGNLDMFPFFSGMLFIFIPFIYAVLGFIFTALFCAFYNLVVRWTGGIEVEIETTDRPAQAAPESPLP